MFHDTSRYRRTPIVQTHDALGRPVQAVELRRLPETAGEDEVVNDGHQLDSMSQRRYGDGARFWHIADANTALEANALVQRPGAVLKVPQR